MDIFVIFATAKHRKMLIIILIIIMQLQFGAYEEDDFIIAGYDRV